MKFPSLYRTLQTLQVDGLSIFYRQTGPKDTPPFFYCTVFCRS